MVRYASGSFSHSAKAAQTQATVIEINAEAVDGAINAVRGALAQGQSWAELERLIRDESEAGNPVASLIRKLSLDRNKITVELPDWVEEGLEDAESDSDGDSEDQQELRQTPMVLVGCLPQCAPHVEHALVGGAGCDVGGISAALPSTACNRTVAVHGRDGAYAGIVMQVNRCWTSMRPCVLKFAVALSYWGP